MDRQALEAVAEELQALAGGRIQRVDRIDEGAWVLEVRVPGRTLRLLIASYPERWLGLVGPRPGRRVEGGTPQGVLRKRLVGRKLSVLELDGDDFVLDAGETRVRFGRDRMGAIRATASAGRGPPDLIAPPEVFERAEAAGRRYVERVAQRVEKSRSADLERAIRAAIKKRLRLLAKVERDAARMKELSERGRYGELLKSSLSSIPRGAREAEVKDWSKGVLVKVPLDPALSARDNMTRYFTQARRGARGLPKAQAKRGTVQSEVDRLDAALLELKNADDEALIRLRVQLQELNVGSGTPQRPGSNRASGAAAHPLDRYSRRFTAKDGSEIRVGKGAVGNDRLTASARGPDLWLHARGVPGAHVVLRSTPGRVADSESVLDAAHLAAHYSSAKNDAKVDVLCTEARHVKKTKGAPAGQVGVARSRTLRVTMEPGRLARLFASAKA